MVDFETLINEEAFLLAKFFRKEREKWTPCTRVILFSSPDYKKYSGYTDYENYYDQ
jgi:hypothetical protein